MAEVQAEVQAKFEEEFASYEAGLYREQPRDWLATSWQGDALQVGLFCIRHVELSLHPKHSLTCLSSSLQSGVRCNVALQRAWLIEQ